MFVLLPHLAAVVVKPLRIDGLVAAVFSPFDAAGILNTLLLSGVSSPLPAEIAGRARAL